LRINVPNMICNAVFIMPDGKSIISGWSDCKIRAFYPESGACMYIMNHTYGSEVTAVTGCPSGTHIISGSDRGHVVMWPVPEKRQTKDFNYGGPHDVLMHNKGRICTLVVTKDGTKCVAGCSDGLCGILDLCCKSLISYLRADTICMDLCLHPMEHQVITCGSNLKLVFWELFDSSLIREVDGSLSGTINAIDVTSDGCDFVTGGDDKLVKVWRYDECMMTHLGQGHSSPITRVKISPDDSYIVSVGSDGAIFLWDFPPKVIHKEPEKDQCVCSAHDID